MDHYPTLERGRICVVKQGASVLEFRLDLGLGQVQDNTRLSIIVMGQHPTRQQSHNSSGKLLRIFPLPLQHFPSGSLSLQAQGRTLHPVSRQNTSCSLQGTGSQARGKGAAALPRWVSSKGAWKSMDRGAWWARVQGSQRIRQD